MLDKPSISLSYKLVRFCVISMCDARVTIVILLYLRLVAYKCLHCAVAFARVVDDQFNLILRCRSHASAYCGAFGPARSMMHRTAKLILHFSSPSPNTGSISFQVSVRWCPPYSADTVFLCNSFPRASTAFTRSAYYDLSEISHAHTRRREANHDLYGVVRVLLDPPCVYL